MENKMQDSKREELRERMAKHEFLDSQLYRKDPIDGSWDSFTTVTEYVLDFISSEISKAKEEMFTKDESYHLVNLLEGGIKITDSITQSEIFKSILDKLSNKNGKEDEK